MADSTIQYSDELAPRKPGEKAAYLEGVEEGRRRAVRDGQAAVWIPADGKRFPFFSDRNYIHRVLVLCDWYREPVIGWCFNDTNGWRVEGSPSMAPVTHWMPLPPAPAARTWRGE